MIATLYRAVLRRTSTFALVAVGGAFIFERTFDLMADTLYENVNRGKLWDDIKHKYE
ncbi:ubiquinol-cytochrome C reductase complex subunit oxen [Arctopsyche grandis]|uniref:ubiquinol-cytochrome C reductase complex subunit oxen n=1 Tax=Arctopsyche grandis TaxID=121162 RepID=UPI00406D799B